MSRDSQRVCLLPIAVALLLASVALPGFAQTENGYRQPAQVLVDLVDRPPTPQVRLSGDSRWLLLLEQASLPSIAELSEPELRLGGLRFKPDNYGPSRRRTLTGMVLRDVASGESREVRGLPDPPRLDHITFSPDSRHVAFTQTRRDRIELWVADVETAEARRLLERPLNLNARLRPQWLSDSKTIVAAFRVEDAGEPPAAPTVPTGPVIQENLGTKAPNRTYQDLLKSPHDEAVFSYYLTAQLAIVGLDGSFVPLGEPDLVSDYSPSPDGRYVLVETLHPPFSYLVPARRFPTRVEVLDLAGGTRRLLFDLPLHEDVPVPFGSVPTGPRSFEWRRRRRDARLGRGLRRRRRGTRGRAARRALLLEDALYRQAHTLDEAPAPLRRRHLGDGRAGARRRMVVEDPPAARLPGGARPPGCPRQAPDRPLLRGPLRRSRLPGHPCRRPRPAPAAHRRRRPDDLPDRRRSLARGRPSFPRRLRPRLRRVPAAFPILRPVLRETPHLPRRGRPDLPDGPRIGGGAAELLRP